MRSLEYKQSKLRHYAGAPKRFLKKARDLYVESMVSLDGIVGAPPIPKKFGGTTCKARITTFNNGDGLRELLRSASERGIGGKAEYDRRQSMVDTAAGGGGRVEKSSSVIGLGKIGTIYEESPFDFEEEKNKVDVDFLFSRSRSCATNNVKNNFGFY